MDVLANPQVFAAALESVSNSVVITDKDGFIRWVNRAFEELTGYSFAEVIGCNPRLLRSGHHDEAFYEDLWSTILAGQPWRGQITNRRKDGNLFVEDMCITPVTNQEGVITHFVATKRDLTDSMVSERALRESEENYRQVVENAPEGIYVQSEERFQYVNATGQRLFGAASPEQLLGQPVMERIHPVSRPLAAQRIQLLSQDRRGGPPLEETYLRLDGAAMDVEVSAVPIVFENQNCALVFFRDITQRKLTEDAERRSRALLHSVVEGATDAIYVKDRDGRYRLANTAACKLVGRTAAEILDHDDAALFDNAAAQSRMTNDRAIMDRGTGEIREDEITLPTGERRTVLTAEGPVIDDEHKVIGVYGISRDITERKRNQEEHARLQEQLLHAQKMESVGRLAGGVAHDFNNSLTVINGYSHLLLSQLTPGDPMHEAISEIRKAGERAATLTQQLLAFSRKQILRPKSLDLNEVIADVGKMIQRLIGEDIRLVTVPGSSLGLIRADAVQLHQILMNLAVNARDAMPNGGRIVIETSSVDLDESYAAQHPGVSPGAYILLAFSDTGIGMDKEVQSHLFEPFFTTKRAGEGTGLGLATVYGIVKQSGGSIWVYSEPGHGTTFKIYLPKFDESVAEKKAESKLPVKTLRGTETVLLVEDEEELRKLAEVVLRRYGYRVLEAANAADALLHSKTYTGPIQLMLSDLVMPGMTGPELAEQLKPTRPEMEVLFMSGYAEGAIIDRGILDSSATFLAKPFSPDALLSRVREVLGPMRRGHKSGG